jgi:small-conductance mechanosensitive channel
MLGKIKTVLNKVGIEIPVPQRVIWFTKRAGTQEENTSA